MLVRCQNWLCPYVGNLAIGDSNFYHLTIGDFDKDNLDNSPKDFIYWWLLLTLSTQNDGKEAKTLSVHDVGNLAIGDSNFYDLTIGDFDSTMLATLQTFPPHTSDFYQLLFIINIDLSLQPLWNHVKCLVDEKASVLFRNCLYLVQKNCW